MYHSRLLILAEFNSPPLPREARKLWRFIKLLGKEDNSLYRVLVWAQFPRPPAQSAEALAFQ